MNDIEKGMCALSLALIESMWKADRGLRKAAMRVTFDRRRGAVMMAEMAASDMRWLDSWCDAAVKVSRAEERSVYGLGDER